MFNQERNIFDERRVNRHEKPFKDSKGEDLKIRREKIRRVEGEGSKEEKRKEGLVKIKKGGIYLGSKIFHLAKTFIWNKISN